MKNLYLLAVGTLLTTNLFAQNGNFVNGGFENWSDVVLYDYPTQWKNSNQQEYRGGVGITKSTDASDGVNSIEIGAYHSDSGDTLSGYVFHGELDGGGPSAGVPYSSVFDEVRFDYKSDLQTGDSAFLIIIRSMAGTMGSMEVYPVAFGSQSSWTQASVSISAGVQDSLFIGFTLGSPEENDPSNPSSWVRMDNIEMYNLSSAIADIPDPSFEDWSTQTTEEPDTWYTANPIMVPLGGSNVIKSTDANSGTYSAQLTTVFEPQNGDSIAGFLSNGPISFQGAIPFQGAPYFVSPETFSGAYKYTGVNGDIAFIQIEFFNNGSLIETVTQPLVNQITWQNFSTSFTLSSAPDSMKFIAFSGDNPGSVLHLDDLELSDGNVSLNEFESMSLSVYPNPATSSVMIKAEGVYNYAIVDLTGNIVLSSKDVTGAIELDINNLTSGTYFVNVSNSIGTQTHKLIVQ